MRQRDRAIEDALQSVDTEGSWAISYGDMVTLLLTFFIIFFSIDTIRDQQQALRMSLMKTLSADVKEGSSAVMKQDAGFSASGVVTKWGGKVTKHGNRIIIEFPDVSFFNSGQLTLTKEGTKQLESFAENYIPFAGRYYLGTRAFTDDRAPNPNSRYKDNLELSALRAIAAMRVLQKAGIPLGRMRLGGYGEMKQTAIDLGSSSIGTDRFSLARKVVLVIEQDLSEE